MSDADGDSTMHSSPRSSVSDDLFPGADAANAADISGTGISSGGGVALPMPSTPAANIVKTAELSPPNSQGAPALAAGSSSSASTTAANAAGAQAAQDATTINANGKRVYHTANTGAALEAKGKGAVDGDTPLLSSGGSGSINNSGPADLSTSTSLLDGGVSLGNTTTSTTTTMAMSSSPDGNGNGSSKPVAPSVHAASGYRWEREADAPGWAWRNKKAQEDWYKAEETFVDRDRMVKARYGDPLEAGPGGVAAAPAAPAVAGV